MPPYYTPVTEKGDVSETQKVTIDMARNLVGYSISGQHNRTDFLQNEASLPHCPVCLARYDFFTHNPDYEMGRKRRGHLYYTYDSVPIVTQPFRSFVLQNGYQNVSFLSFRKDPERFHLIVDDVIPYDQTIPELELDEYCNFCKRFNSIATGTSDRFLAISGSLDDGIYRSDLMFGHGNNKFPLLIVGLETTEKMKTFGLKGIIYTPTYAR